MADWEEELGLKNVRPFERPMTAGPNDVWRGKRNEFGDKIYETPTGEQYSVRAATAEESKTTRAKAEDWIKEGAPLPSGEQVLEALKGMPQAAYESAAGAVRGTGTVGEALAVVPTSGAIGAASRIGQAVDPNVVSAMGATYKVPRYTKGSSESTRDTEVSPYINFREPLIDIAREMEIPSKGLKGSELLKQLQDNPTVRNAQISSQGIANEVDPLKRYTREEVIDIFAKNVYDVAANPTQAFETYQRQYDLVDQEVPNSYTAYAIDAQTSSPEQLNFKYENAIDSHFTPQTIAHVRLSERQSGNKRYVLIEELQSDILQKGFVNPVKDWETAKKNYLKKIPEYEAERYQRLSKITEDDIKAYTTYYRDLDSDTLLKYYGTTDIDKIDIDGVAKTVAKKLGFNPEKETDLNKTYAYLFELSELTAYDKFKSPLTVPPVAKTEETVRLGIDTAIAHAAQRGLTSVVIPPFEEIVKKRFSDPDQIEKAMDPKSGFYATYVKGVEKVLKDLKAEYGDAVKIDSIDLEYDPNKSQFDFGDPDDLIDEDFVNNPAPVTYSSPEAAFFSDTFKNTFLSYLRDVGANAPLSFGRKGYRKVNEIAEKILNRGNQSVRDALGEDYEYKNAYEFAIREVFPDANLLQAYNDVADGIYPTFTEAVFAQNLPKVKEKPRTIFKQGIEINFEGLVNEGYDLTRPKFAEGGMVENIDPISGNEVPLGAKPEEVRDDVPIMASEGEYVLPANVVRYIGLDRIEKMVKQAKKGLEELDAEGRIGGEKATMDEDLPFSPEELVAVDEAPAMMAEGGLVSENDMDIDPATGLPRWLLTMQQNQMAPPAPVAAPTPAPTTNTVSAPKERESGSEERRNPPPAPVGLAKPVKDWSPEDYDKYSTFRTSPDAKIAQGFASLVPGGAFLSNVAQRNTERTVNQNLTEMLKSGKDLNGKPLSTEQLSTLRETYAKISGEPISRAPGFTGAVQAIAGETGLIKPRTPTQEQIDRYNERVQGDSFINRAIDFISGNKKPRTSPVSETRTTELTKRGQQDRYGNTLVSGGRNKDSDRTVRTPGGKTVTTSKKPTNKVSTRTVTKKK